MKNEEKDSNIESIKKKLDQFQVEELESRFEMKKWDVDVVININCIPPQL